jgi:tight adherence protein C
MPMLLFLSIVCLGAAAYLAGELATVAGRQRQLSLRRASNYGVMRRLTGSATERVKFSERVVGPAAMKLARIVLRLNPKTTVESVQAKLVRAGLTRRLTPTSFLAGKAVFAICGLVLGLTFAPSIGIGGGLFLTIAFAGVGFLLPDLVVSSRSKRRREAVKAEMPDALDLLAVSVEAGMGFDGAIAKLTEHMDGELADEFALMLNEIRIGEGRAEALKKMADRVPAHEVASFVRAIIQADQLGISLGRILRIQAADARNKRQAAAEEKAMKAPIKMLFPTVVFIFPAMFLVILGPAFLNLSKFF